MDGMVEMSQGEPGAVDNRLSLIPNEFGVDGWEDGKTYEISLKVRQISPGEFEVIERTDSEEEEPEEAQTEGNPGDSEAMAEENYPNPAVQRMIGR